MGSTPTNGPLLRVLVTCADGLALAGLESYFLDDGRWSVFPHRPDQEDLVERTLSVQPDLVVWDLGWEALEAARLAEILSRLPATLLLVATSEDGGAARAAGARAVLQRSVAPERLMAAAMAAAEGLWVSDLEPAPLTIPEVPETVLVSEALTPRETEVLRSMSQGLTNKAISQQLGITEHTVKFHIQTILRKLDAQSRTEAVVRAARLGLIPL